MAAIAIPAIAMASAAAAQLEPEIQTGSRIPVKPEEVEAARAGRIHKAFGQCVYESNPSAALNLLLHSDPASVDLQGAKTDDLVKQFEMRTCLGKHVRTTESALSLQISPDILRTMLAEEAYLAANTLPPKLPEGAAEAVERTFVSKGDDLASAQASAAFGDCIVFRETSKADALLRTMPGSIAERAAAVALAPVLGACLDQGATIALTPASVRSFVADALWNRFTRPHHSEEAVEQG